MHILITLLFQLFPLLCLSFITFPSKTYCSNIKDGEFHRGLVTLTIDDGFQSAYDALPLLQKHEIQATFYITTSLLGTHGYLDEQQIKVIHQNGHEIGSHCVTHSSLKGKTFENINKELKNSKALLEGITQTPVISFAPPFGQFDNLMMALIKINYQSCRTIHSGYNVKNRLNPYFIKAWVVYNSTPLKQIEEWVDQAAAEKKWLVLLYHHIGPSTSALSISLNDFENHLITLKTRGVKTSTMAEALAEALPQCGH